MTFAYIIKQVFQQWITLVSKNQMAHSLVVRQSPSIEMAKQIKHICCPTIQPEERQHEQ